jgi:gamma-glutamyl hercynylcysteine S-oxide synthase
VPVAPYPGEVASDLLQRLSDARSRTDELFAIVKPGCLYERPIAERHRIIFYIGHLEAFDWNLLRERLLGAESFHPEFDHLFAFGIDPVGGGLPNDQPSDWPSLSAVQGYVKRIREVVDEGLRALASGPEPSKAAEFPPSQLLNVAIEHRLMHAETLAYMLHQLPSKQKIHRARSPEPPAEELKPEMIRIPAGRATLGLPREQFGWDNEFELHTEEVPAFAIDKYKVTNRQWLEFMDAGGYERQDLWSKEAWEWKQAQNILHPSFWRRDGDRWYYRTMFEEVRMPMDWPVYVSHAEASAYARWKGKSLPTEAQWHRAAYGTEQQSERQYPWGNGTPSAQMGNFDFHRWDPVSVAAFPRSHSAYGVAGMLGNGWEWTSSLFQAFKGFQKFSFYPGYSADFFDGKHFVMKGASARTAACMLRRSFRNWFQPHYQYVYAGFRCVSE